MAAEGPQEEALFLEYSGRGQKVAPQKILKKFGKGGRLLKDSIAGRPLKSDKGPVTTRYNVMTSVTFWIRLLFWMGWTIMKAESFAVGRLFSKRQAGKKPFRGLTLTGAGPRRGGAFARPGNEYPIKHTGR